MQGECYIANKVSTDNSIIYVHPFHIKKNIKIRRSYTHLIWIEYCINSMSVLLDKWLLMDQWPSG